MSMSQNSLPGRARCSRTSGCRESPRRREDEEIQAHVRAHVREVHDFVAGLMREHQAAGAIPADRDPDAEAWLFLAGGLLRSFADRLGGVLGAAEFAAIGRERRRWLSGA